MTESSNYNSMDEKPKQSQLELDERTDTTLDSTVQTVAKSTRVRYENNGERSSQAKTNVGQSRNGPSKTLSNEHDMELKLRFKKILWQMGHYARIDVKIGGYGEQEQTGRADGVGELTDIDVLGFNVHDDFQVHYIVVDCKNGKKVSPSNRLFWIRGVMESLNDARGYMVMGQKTIPAHLQDAANHFNIALMDDRNLIAMERIYKTNELTNGKIFSEELFIKQERVNEKHIADLLEYRRYHYWINEDHTNIHNIIGLLKQNATSLNPKNKNHQIAVMDLTTLFTITVFKLCSYIIRTSLSDVQKGVLVFLYNGTYNLEKYRSVIKVVDQIFKTTAKNYEELKGIISYKPAFFEQLVELCITLIRRPHYAKDILRYMDIALYHTILPNRNEVTSVREVLQSDFSDVTLKLMFDIMDFIFSNTGINQELMPKQLIYGV